MEKFKLIPYDPQKDLIDELEQMKKIETDLLTLSEIMKDFNLNVVEQNEILKELNSEIVQTIDTIETSNNAMKNAIEIQSSTFATKLSIATIFIVGLNAPVGLLLGTKILIGTITASGIASILWISKN